MSAKDLAFTADWNFKSPDFVDMQPIPLEQWVDFSVTDEMLANIGTAPDMDPADR